MPYSIVHLRLYLSDYNTSYKPDPFLCPHMQNLRNESTLCQYGIDVSG